MSTLTSKEQLTAVAIDRNGYRHDWAERCVTENTGCERYYRADEVDKELERLRAAPETRAFPQPGQDPLCEVHHYLMGDGRCSCKTVHVGGMPDYVQRVSDCIVGADVAGLTMDWARILFDLKELARRKANELKAGEPVS
jgi:hypothetical protein